MRRMRTGLAAACAALILTLVEARAEPVVTLRSHDGATQVTGELMGYDGTTYRLRTGVGTISLEADKVSCEGEGCPVDIGYGERFGVAGSNLIGEALLPALVEGYADTLEARLIREVGAGPNRQVLRLVDADEREIAAIELDARGTDAGFEALAAGEAVIALASRRIEAGEVAGEAAEATGATGGTGAAGATGATGAGREGSAGTPGEHILALDGLILIVHPENPVRALTLDQAAALMAGRIGNWAQLGGPDAPVNLYVPADGSGTLASFVDQVMAPRNLEVAEAAERVADNADLSDLVSIDPGGLGVTGVAYARAAEPLAIRQQCGLVSHPTSFAIKAEEYPLSRRLYAYTADAEMPGHARALLGFALSDSAQPIVAEAGFVDRAVETRRLDDQGGRLVHSLTSPEEFSLPLFREMLNELKEARRLSVTFRFAGGSTDLEARSLAEAERFAKALAEGDYAGHEVLLVGFADSVGEFDVNRALATRRAEAVLAALTGAVPEGALADGALADGAIQVRSYGELTPVGCNETPDGRELNRRVEVWVRDAG